MHHKYHTEACVISSTHTGEANRYLTLITRELGMIRAVAQGVRKVESKLRYGLQDASYCTVELVRGREVWRVTSARPLQQFFPHRRPEVVRVAFGNIIRLLVRLMPGEEGNPALFDSVVSGLLCLDRAEDRRQAAGIEYVLVLRILYHLGYLQGGVYDEFLAEEVDTTLAARAYANRKQLLSDINHSLQETQL